MNRFIRFDDKPSFEYTQRWCLNRRHPLAHRMLGGWVFNEFGGNSIVDVVTMTQATLQTVGSGGTPEWNENGFRISSPWGSANGNWFSVNTAQFQGIGTGNYSLVAKVKLEDIGATYLPTLFTFNSYDPQWGFKSTTGALHTWDGGNRLSGVASLENGIHSIAYVREGTSANQYKGYVNGKLDCQGTHADSLPNPSIVRIGWDNYSAEWLYGTIFYLYFFGRALSAVEIAWIHQEPYAMLRRSEVVWHCVYVSTGAITKIFGETISLPESSVRRGRSNRLSTETASITETLLRRARSVRVISETISISESLVNVTYTLLVRIISETISLSESLLRRLSSVRLISEAESITETGTRRLWAARMMMETISLQETLLRRAWSVRVISETISISESMVRTIFTGLVKMISETIAISDAAIKRARSIRGIAETINISDMFLKRSWMVKVLTETVNLQDSTIKRLRATKLISETIAIAESILKINVIVRIINETISITEGFISKLSGWILSPTKAFIATAKNTEFVAKLKNLIFRSR